MRPLLSHTDLLNAKRILLMTHFAVGDFVYHGPLLHALKKKYPNIELDIWIDDCRNRPKGWRSERNLALVQWIEQSNIAAVIYPIAVNDDERQKFVRRAKRRKYDIIVYFATVKTERFAQVAKQISSKSKALIVGNEPVKLWSKLKQFKAFHGVDRKFIIDDFANKKETTLHLFDRYRMRYQRCFGELVITPDDEYGMPVRVPDNSAKAVEEWFANEKQERDGDFSSVILINPFSSSSKRDLNSHTLLYLLDAMSEQYPTANFIVITSRSTSIGTKALMAAHEFKVKNRVSIFTATDDFFMLPALMLKASFMVTVETSLMHFASTLDLPQFVIIRTNTANWKPKRYVELFWCDENINEIDGREIAPILIEALKKSVD